MSNADCPPSGGGHHAIRGGLNRAKMGKKEERVLSACTLSWDISLRLLSIGWPAFLPPYLPLPCPPLSSLPASIPPPLSLFLPFSLSFCLYVSRWLHWSLSHCFWRTLTKTAPSPRSPSPAAWSFSLVSDLPEPRGAQQLPATLLTLLQPALSECTAGGRGKYLS